MYKVIVGVVPIGAAIMCSPLKVYAKDSAPCHECCHKKRLPKAHELPLYVDEDKCKVEFVEKPPNKLERELAGIAEHASKYFTLIEDAGKRAANVYETGIAHTRSTYDFLMDDEHRVPRLLTIATGGVAGFLLAIRGGFIKKIIYPATGLALVTSAFYPKEAKDYVLTGFKFSQKQVNDVLVNYGGYDTDEIARKASDKMEFLKETLRMDWLTSLLREQFNKNKSKEENMDNTSNKNLEEKSS